MTDEPKPIADAASLDDTDEIRPIRPRVEPAPADDSGGYELEIDPFGDPTPAPSPADLDPLPTTGQRRSKPRKPGESAEVAPASPRAPEPAPTPTRAPRPKAAPAPRESTGDTSEFDAEISTVDPVWSRWGEWGPDAIRIGLVGLGTLVLAWLVGGWSTLPVLMLGGAAMVLLSYPILITMERPVRITPEQAVTDFFAAASHHFPHYRRMWLLLSDRGREPGRFPGFEAFRGHWASQIEGWKRSGGAGRYTPLKFAVVEFRADKSTGKATSKAEYTVHVLVRGRVQDGPVASFPMSHGLVKGPDRMWYMNRGTLGPGKR